MKKQFLNEAANYAEKFNNDFNAEQFVNKYCSYYIKDQLDSDVEELLGADTVADMDDDDKETFVEIFNDCYMEAVNELVLSTLEAYKAGNLEDFDEYDLEWMADCTEDELLEGLQEGYFEGVVDMNYIADLLNEFIATKTWAKAYKEAVTEQVDNFYGTEIEIEYELNGYNGFSFSGLIENFTEAIEVSETQIIDYLVDECVIEVTLQNIYDAIERESSSYIEIN